MRSNTENKNTACLCSANTETQFNCSVCVPDALARLAFPFSLRPGSPPESSPERRGAPGAIDLITLSYGILLWVIDIGTDLHVAHKAYRDYGTAWGHTLTFLLISSITVVYCLHIYALRYELDGICSTLKRNPVFLLGPLGR